MLQHNSLYSGVTRDKRLMVMVGQKKEVAIAVPHVSGHHRRTKLDERLGRTQDDRASLKTTCERRYMSTMMFSPR